MSDLWGVPVSEILGILAEDEGIRLRNGGAEGKGSLPADSGGLDPNCHFTFLEISSALHFLESGA